MHEEILIKIDVKYINYINRIMEGYEYLGVVTTVKDGKMYCVFVLHPIHIVKCRRY